MQQASEGGWECVLAAVCDGLGGLQKGELASAEVIRGLAGWFRTEWPRLREQAGGEAEILKSWDRLLVGKKSAAGKLWRFKMDCSWGPRCRRCSWRMAVITCLHVGDCRMYEITGTGIRQLTRDQSWAAEAAEKGILTAGRPVGSQTQRSAPVRGCGRKRPSGIPARENGAGGPVSCVQRRLLA